MDVLQDWPELNAIAGHQAHGAFDRREMTQGGKLVEQIENRQARDGRTRHVRRLWVTSRRSHLE